MLYEKCMQRCAICMYQGVNWGGREKFWADCGYVCGEAGLGSVGCLRPLLYHNSLKAVKKKFFKMPQNFHFCSWLGESQVAIFIFAAGKEQFQFSFL